jgi:hypothetical protein
MAASDPVVRAHLEWLGFVQPTGLVVSALALSRAGVVISRSDAGGQLLLRQATEEWSPSGHGDPESVVSDFEGFARDVLGWAFTPKFYAGMSGSTVPAELVVPLPDGGGSLAPDYAVRDDAPGPKPCDWQLLVRVVPTETDLDTVAHGRDGLETSEHGRMERLLRGTGAPAGLLTNGRVIRLVSAPACESSGWLDFRVADMVLTAGRAICAAMRELFGQARLLTVGPDKRLVALLAGSRKYQNEVSEQLAQQVLHTLYELLRGFQAADDSTGGDLLRAPLEDDPDEVYRGLLTVTLRLVFLLYAEERGMLPQSEAFARGYSLAGLYERLREDANLYPDTMSQRYGAWAQLLVLFRLVHDGADFDALRMPARQGLLFDPNRFAFLEGRPFGAAQRGERIKAPRVPDSTVFHVLEKLLVLRGERLSYRALDVEQIGSVYQTMMGFRLQRAVGRSVAVKAKVKTGAPTAVDLDELLTTPAGSRLKLIKERSERDLTATQAKPVKAATSVEELHAALSPVIDRDATPDLVAPNGMVLEPSDERRKSGSHYTPRELTEPIVRTALKPLLAALATPGRPPTPAAILDLKVCDPALGSGAFLVETCRQLAAALVEAWQVHGNHPPIPADEDETILARRMVAQRCLYGVDRNPVALDLAKLSLWLVTLAREHPLTFVDHALRHGDALVGLTRKQIEGFHWAPKGASGFETAKTATTVAEVAKLRRAIREAGEEVSDKELRSLWRDVDAVASDARAYGDLVISAFFRGSKPKEREAKRLEYAQGVLAGDISRYRPLLIEQREADPPLVPFHWSLEFPEVFDRDRPGFDAIVGNPPFAGKNTLISASPDGYLDWLKVMHEGAHGNADLVAHFFRRAFDLLRQGGRLGLIATNTIGQGDTRGTGLRWICTHGGEIVEARKRFKWPGLAAVVVSVVHIAKGEVPGSKLLDGREVEQITAYLVERGGHEDPARLAVNDGKSFIGSYLLGMGFTFDDTATDGKPSTLAEMRALLEANPANAEVIKPYLGGEEINSDPRQDAHRFVIDFGDQSEAVCRARWPVLMEIVEERVRRDRMSDNRASYRDYWWQFAEKRVRLRAALAQNERVIAQNCGASAHLAMAFQMSDRVFSHSVAVLALGSHGALGVLQSRVHETWARFFSSSMKDDLRYTPSDCFQTFPFPGRFEMDAVLEAAGAAYESFRADLMVRNDQGLTKTFNRFHDPEELSPDIARLRELHEAMDRAVLDAYGWVDVPTACEFLLDYEVEEDEAGTRKKKKPYRYRWPDEVRDDVLARLIELNGERAAEERRTGAAS